eukprot:CAMPEP_0181315470 /NCGR_PEP_ID=MMETSP1101-20121128/15396_1 /TAXON_ID=46948 /ORGANISM="Rhodomonas abbreviata, Strain Caron Lab Isolate" /LENGTH=134 /DNA_ID=CAMNT_0023422687 /DNA_START=109 /DNA_END=513 /DNA_ORIENTATION=+
MQYQQQGMPPANGYSVPPTAYGQSVPPLSPSQTYTPMPGDRQVGPARYVNAAPQGIRGSAGSAIPMTVQGPPRGSAMPAMGPPRGSAMPMGSAVPMAIPPGSAMPMSIFPQMPPPMHHQGPVVVSHSQPVVWNL